MVSRGCQDGMCCGEGAVKLLGDVARLSERMIALVVRPWERRLAT
jgi:hypothetical protein